MKSKTLFESAQERVILFDGGMGTMLFEKGLKSGEAPESWNLRFPERVEDIHKEYLKAGSEAILTNTFGGSSIKLADSNLEGQTTEINLAAAQIARKACSTDNYVVGDIGPTGKLLEPYGVLKESELRTSLEQQVGALLEGGVDALIFETQMDLVEALIGVEIARKMTSLPIAVSFTFNRSKRGYFTLMGNSVKDTILQAEDAGADIVGTNCSLSSREMTNLVKEISLVATKPVYAKANAGQPELIEGKVVYTQSIDDYIEAMPHYLDFGVRLIGGCCGTNPDYIKAMKQIVSKRA